MSTNTWLVTESSSTKLYCNERLELDFGLEAWIAPHVLCWDKDDKEMGWGASGNARKGGKKIQSARERAGN